MHRSETPTDDVERKLAAARARLVMERPFLGVLVLHLPLTAADPRWCRTTATDARGIYYNRAYVESLSLDQTLFVLAHETLHCALSHFHRREHRARRRWDVACDYAVNAILVADGLVPPPGALFHKSYDGMAAEEIYLYVRDDTGDEPQDRHLYDEGEAGENARGEGVRGGAQSPGGRPQPEGPGGAPDAGPADAPSGGAPDANAPGAPRPAPPSGGQREQLAVQWQLRLAGAAQQALRAGKLPASLARAIDALLQPPLPWRMLLARYLMSVARTDYSYARPSRRDGPAILPGLRAAYVDLVVVVDTSGSIAAQELDEFLGEVDAIKGSMNARVTLHACDAALAPEGPWIYEPWEPLRLPQELAGGGGTRFTPAFEWAERLDRPPDLLLYFTDAEGEFPSREPPFPVLWIVKGKAPVPWGQRVQLN